MSRKPRWKDLFTTQGDEIDMAKLQLFGFTLIAILAYVINLFLSNALEGLPEIPPTLHMLLITSQSGYIGGKAVSDKLAVNFIEPSTFTIGETKTIQIVGSGFTDGMKAMIEGGKATPVKFIDSATIEYEFPPQDAEGEKNLILIPINGQNLAVNGAIKVGKKEEKKDIT